MNQREARMYALAWLIARAENAIDDHDPTLSDADNERVTLAFERLRDELQRRLQRAEDASPPRGAYRWFGGST